MRRRKYRWLKAMIMVGLIFLAGFIFLEINLGPTVVAVAEAKTKLVATEIINEAVNRSIISNIDYQDLVEIHKDRQDRIVLMMPNMVKINHLAVETTLEIERNLDQLKSQGFYVPMGLITGSRLFSDTGPPIKIGVIPVGTVDVDVMDEFVEAGINQTKHRIVLNIKTNLKVVVPMLSSTIAVNTQVPVTESIIVGPVPEWYMKFTSQNADNSLIRSFLGGSTNNLLTGQG